MSMVRTELVTEYINGMTIIEDAELVRNAFIRGHSAEKKYEMLTISEFIHYSGFDASSLYINRFYLNLKYDMPILVDDALVDWIGYAGGKHDEDRRKRAAFVRAVQTLDEKGTKYHQFTFNLLQSEIASYHALARAKVPIRLQNFGSTIIERKNIPYADIIAMYPSIPENPSTRQRKFMLIFPSLLNQVMMKVHTESGEIVRKCFTLAGELLRVYNSYQEVFKSIQYRIELIAKEKDISGLKVIAMHSIDGESRAAIDAKMIADQAATIAQLRLQMADWNARSIAEIAK
jgi:hypothetical protein